MTEQDCRAEMDVLKAELRLMQQTIEECETKANAAYVRASMTAEHLATLTERLNKIADGWVR